MTEEEWQTTTEWQALLAYMRDMATDFLRACRQARRLAYTCAMQHRHHMTNVRTLEALDLLERALSSRSLREGLEDAHRMAAKVAGDPPFGITPWYKEGWAAHILSMATIEDHWTAATRAAECLASQTTPRSGWIADAIRELFGNPFRPVVLPGGWQRFHNGLIVRLAQQAHAERRIDTLQVLADALEDAGCADAYLLDHLRSATHLPGCWAVELLRDED